jgi:hypothetical protein
VKVIDGPAVQHVKSVSGAQGRDLEGGRRCQAITRIILVNESSIFRELTKSACVLPRAAADPHPNPLLYRSSWIKRGLR